MTRPLDDLQDAITNLDRADLLLERVTLAGVERLKVTRCRPDGGCRLVHAAWVDPSRSGLEVGVYSLLLSSYWNPDTSLDTDGRNHGGLDHMVTITRRWLVELRLWDDLPPRRIDEMADPDPSPRHGATIARCPLAPCCG